MGKSAPAPTPPKETSAAQTGTSVSTSIANAFLQNMDEVTPDGTKTFTQSGDYTFTDPYTGETYTVPRFTVEQTLSENQQAIKDQSDAAKLNLSTLANNQSAFLNNYMAQPFSYDTGQHEAWAGDLYNKINSDNMAQREEALRSRLSNQGIQVGSEAYDREMANLYEAQDTARNKFLLDSYNTGMNTAMATRNQPINEITALMSGSQVSNPNFTTATGVSGIPTTDNAALISNYDNQLMNQWAQGQAAAGSAIGALGGLFSLSDERAKEDKEKIAETKDGMGIYKFRYKGSPKTEIGLMAQQVAKKKPGAVAKTPSGLMAVDYGKALQ